MPHLLNFLKNQDTVDQNHYAVRICHTANGILTSLTGVSSDRHGIAVANSYPEGAAFNSHPIGEQQTQQLINQGQALVDEDDSCRQNLGDCEEL